MGGSDTKRDKDEEDINLGREEDQLKALEDTQGFRMASVLGAKDGFAMEVGSRQRVSVEASRADCYPLFRAGRDRDVVATTETLGTLDGAASLKGYVLDGGWRRRGVPRWIGNCVGGVLHGCRCALCAVKGNGEDEEMRNERSKE